MKYIKRLKKLTEIYYFEYNWHSTVGNDEELYLFVDAKLFDDFCKIFEDAPSLFDDGGIECNLKQGYLCLELVDIFSYFGEEDYLELVFPKEIN